MLIAFDIDGTLADLSHRLHFIDREVTFYVNADGLFGWVLRSKGHEHSELSRSQAIYQTSKAALEAGDDLNKPDWQGFFAAVKDDEPIKEMVHLLGLILADVRSTDVVFVTGRSSECREATEKWLRDHTQVWLILHAQDFVDYRNRPLLYMRTEGDHRPDHEVKRDLVTEIEYSYGKVPDMVFDDRQQVVDMWRELGIRCLQVAEGAF